MYDNFKMVKMLIEHGANPSTKEFDNSPLYWANIHNNIEIMQYLIDHGVDINQKCGTDGYNLLNLECGSSNFTKVKFIIENGCDVNNADTEGNTPIHKSIIFDRFETTQLLIANGADVNKQNNFLMTPLHLASLGWQLETVKLLIENGALQSINVQNHFGKTPLQLSLENENLAISKYLIENGAKIYKKYSEFMYISDEEILKLITEDIML